MIIPHSSNQTLRNAIQSISTSTNPTYDNEERLKITYKFVVDCTDLLELACLSLSLQKHKKIMRDLEMVWEISKTHHQTIITRDANLLRLVLILHACPTITTNPRRGTYTRIFTLFQHKCIESTWYVPETTKLTSPNLTAWLYRPITTPRETKIIRYTPFKLQKHSKINIFMHQKIYHSPV